MSSELEDYKWKYKALKYHIKLHGGLVSSKLQEFKDKMPAVYEAKTKMIASRKAHEDEEAKFKLLEKNHKLENESYVCSKSEKEICKALGQNWVKISEILGGMLAEKSTAFQADETNYNTAIQTARDAYASLSDDDKVLVLEKDAFEIGKLQEVLSLKTKKGLSAAWKGAKTGLSTASKGLSAASKAASEAAIQASKVANEAAIQASNAAKKLAEEAKTKKSWWS